MTVGNSTFMGLGMPVYGEAELTQQTAATDILTITGATSQSGDFIVCRNSTGAELFVVTSAGNTTAGGSMTLSGAVTNSSTYLGTLSSTAAAYSIGIAVTSTGAIADGAITNNAILVYGSSKSVLNAVIAYDGRSGDGTSSCNYALAFYGSKAPTYLFAVGATTVGVGAATTNGLFTAAPYYYVSAPSTSIPMGAVKILAGSKAYWIPCIPDTGMAAS